VLSELSYVESLGCKFDQHILLPRGKLGWNRVNLTLTEFPFFSCERKSLPSFTSPPPGLKQTLSRPYVDPPISHCWVTSSKCLSSWHHHTHDTLTSSGRPPCHARRKFLVLRRLPQFSLETRNRNARSVNSRKARTLSPTLAHCIQGSQISASQELIHSFLQCTSAIHARLWNYLNNVESAVLYSAVKQRKSLCSDRLPDNGACRTTFSDSECDRKCPTYTANSG